MCGRVTGRHKKMTPVDDCTLDVRIPDLTDLLFGTDGEELEENADVDNVEIGEDTEQEDIYSLFDPDKVIYPEGGVHMHNLVEEQEGSSQSHRRTEIAR